LCALATAVVLWLSPAISWGQGKQVTAEELAAARKMFVDGKALEKDGAWVAALVKFKTVAKIKMTPQVRFHIALCHEHLGKLVDAVNGFELAEQEAKATGKAADVAVNAPKRAEALRARLAQLMLRVAGKVYTSKIFLDDREVSLALVDTNIPVDAGKHTVKVRRAGKTTFSKELTFEEAQSQELKLVINDPKPPPAPVKGPDPEPDAKPGPAPRQVFMTDDPPQWIAYVVAGVGAGALVVSGILWSQRNQALSQLECEDPATYSGCKFDGQGKAQQAEQLDVAAKVLVGVGAAGVATGVALWFLLMPDDDQPTTGNTQAQWLIAPTLGGVSVGGTF
jgi:hypothetical protein